MARAWKPELVAPVQRFLGSVQGDFAQFGHLFLWKDSDAV